MAYLHKAAHVLLFGAVVLAVFVEEGEGYVKGEIRLAPHGLRPPHSLAGQELLGKVQHERVLVGMAQIINQLMEGGLLDAAVAFRPSSRRRCCVALPAVLARRPRRCRRLDLVLLLLLLLPRDSGEEAV